MPTANLNFADQIYQLFKSEQTTAIKYNQLASLFEQTYGAPFDTIRLRELPFIQFDKTGTKFKETMIFLVIELDDCCFQCRTYCKLLHTIDSTDKFKQIYREPAHSQPSKLTDIKIPHIRLTHRLKDILNENVSNSFHKEMKLCAIITQHNRKYPSYKSHEPTSHGISIRFKSTFLVTYSQYRPVGQHLISLRKQANSGNNSALTNRNIFDCITDDYCNKNIHCLSIAISPKWTDTKLIPELIEHVVQTKKKVVDVYIRDTVRLGFFSTKSLKIAQTFVENAKNQKIKCLGRTVYASIVTIPKSDKHKHVQSGYRIKLQNLPAVLGMGAYDDWIYKITATQKKKYLIYDSLIIFPKRTKEIAQCFMLFNSRKDCKFVIKKLNNGKFRGFALKFKYLENLCQNVSHKRPSITVKTKQDIIKQHKVSNLAITVPLKKSKKSVMKSMNAHCQTMPAQSSQSQTVPVNAWPKPAKKAVNVDPKPTATVHTACDAKKVEEMLQTFADKTFDDDTSMETSIEEKSQEETCADEQIIVEQEHENEYEYEGETKTNEEMDGIQGIQYELNSLQHETDNILTPHLVEINKFIISFESNRQLYASQERQIQRTFRKAQKEQNDILDKINRNEDRYRRLKVNMAEIVYEEKWKDIIQHLNENILAKLDGNALIFNNVLFGVKELMKKHSIRQLEGIKCVIGIILQYGVENELYINECVDLLMNLSVNETEISQSEYSQIIVSETQTLFEIERKRGKAKYFGVMVLIGELYNVGLFNLNLLFVQVLNVIFGDNYQNKLGAMDIEAVCKLFVQCCKLLDKQDTVSVDNYIEILMNNVNAINNNEDVGRINGLICKVNELRSTTELKQMYDKLGRDYDKLETEYVLLENRYEINEKELNKILNDHKILQIKYNEIQQKYTENIRKSQYKLWSFKDIANWILDLDKKRYEKYYNLLCENMANESIDGTCLVNMDKNDLHRLGITQFKDKYSIYSQIQELIQKKQMKNLKNISKKCQICNNNIACFACIPCGHLSVCQKCKAYPNGKCPSCQQKYQSLQPIYA